MTKKKILIIEDNVDVLSMLSMILKTYDYEVIGIDKGSNAINIYKEAFEKNEPFDAVIMDLVIFGNLRAPDTLKILKKINPSIKAILTSGYTTDPEMTNFKDFGFVAAFPKPFMIDELITLLESIIK